MKSQPDSIIIGAGLGGLMMAIRLARRRYDVRVYERRPRVDLLHASQRSFTVTLSHRGVAALDDIDLKDVVLQHATPLRGRMIHDRDGTTTYVPYGNDDGEQLYAILRHEMNAVLYEAAQDHPNIEFFFEHSLQRLQKDDNTLYIQNISSSDSEELVVQSPLIIGADGIFSTVRQQIQRGERADYHQECLDWVYANVFIPPEDNNQHVMDGSTLHLWPRGHCTFFAFPNRDGTFSTNFIAPYELFSKLNTAENVRELMEEDFADLLALAPTLPQQLVELPISHFITTYTSPWFYEDKIVLLGDAVHAVTPFWGEGMNAAYEDCVFLDRLLAEHENDREEAFVQYQKVRKPDTDLLADLANQNFVELRDTTGSPTVMARKVVERKLYQLLPNHWLPLNIMISHRSMSYSAAFERYQRQQKIARWCGADVLVWAVLLQLWIQRGIDSFRMPLSDISYPRLFESLGTASRYSRSDHVK